MNHKSIFSVSDYDTIVRIFIQIVRFSVASVSAVPKNVTVCNISKSGSWPSTALLIVLINTLNAKGGNAMDFLWVFIAFVCGFVAGKLNYRH
ncbi:MAG: hypothetical protein ACI8VC_001596 [Candidatus Endobugula sp.]|jgi:hypothetical protein